MLSNFSEPVKAFIGPLSGAHSPRAKYCNVEAQRGRRENAKNALDFSHPATNAAMKPEKIPKNQQGPLHTLWGIPVAVLKCLGAMIAACHLFNDARFLARRKCRERSGKEEKMRLAKLLSSLSFVFLLAGCDLVAQQYPPFAGFNSSTAAPALGNTPSSQSSSIPQSVTQPQITGSQRGQHIRDKALQGLALGGAIAGPYGAGGGLIIGLLAGLFTADAYYTQLNGQIQSEQDKDKALEAKIEQELQRQRELETQLAVNAGNSTRQNQADQSQSGQQPTVPQVTTLAMKESSTGAASKNKETTSTSAPSPFKNVELKDINGDGVPDLWIYYNPLKPGEIVRQEEATHWDGKVDSWSYFKDGKLVRREVDTKGKGGADTVYYYDKDQIVREERDERGMGNASFRVLYQNGRRFKVEEDSSGGGKIDHWIYYDTSADGEVISKEERDLNGDGVVDLWAYYQNGRLVRRDLSAVGLELVSKQLPSSPADPKETFRAQLVKD